MTQIALGLFVFCLLHVYVDSQIIIDCAPGYVPAPCGRFCESTCKDPRVKMCKVDPEKCPIQCRCQEGLVRNEETDECIEQKYCPK